MEQDNKHITEQFVSFETAKLLKDKGFDEWCFAAYNVGGNIESAMELYGEETIGNGECSEGDIAAPTQQMALKWLRKNHDLHLEIHRFNKRWFYVIIDMVDDKTLFSEDCETYDECINNGLKYCLENLV